MYPQNNSETFNSTNQYSKYSVDLTTLADTEKLAQKLAQQITQGIVFLQGDLGAGKTTLVRYWLQALGFTGNVKSPTYTLVEPYLVQQKQIFHFDLYRLNDPEELDMMGFQEYLQAQNLVFIEWASKAGYLAPQPDSVISIGLENNIRHVQVTTHQAIQLI